MIFFGILAWVGSYRRRELNIGCDSYQIRPNLVNLLKDIGCRIEFNHFYSLEPSARVEHRLVQIHPFPNGNGRHSRILTDCVRVMILSKPPQIWASGDLDEQSEERSQYSGSLRQADGGDYEPFKNYLRSKVNE